MWWWFVLFTAESTPFLDDQRKFELNPLWKVSIIDLHFIPILSSIHSFSALILLKQFGSNLPSEENWIFMIKKSFRNLVFKSYDHFLPFVVKSLWGKSDAIRNVEIRKWLKKGRKKWKNEEKMKGKSDILEYMNDSFGTRLVS